jgi:hypothetical protein
MAREPCAYTLVQSGAALAKAASINARRGPSQM